MQEFKVSKKSLTIWRIRLLVPAFACAFLNSLFFDFLSVAWLIITAVWILAFLFFYCFYFPVRLKKLSLTTDGVNLTLKSGVFYNVTRVLPIDKIQFIRVKKTVLERIFKVSSAIIYASGTTMYLPPFDDVGEILRGIGHEI